MSVLRLAILLSFMVFANAPICAATLTPAMQPSGSACRQTVIDPATATTGSAPMHRTAFLGDTLAPESPAPCCRFNCTQMLSTTRLQPPRTPGRT